MVTQLCFTRGTSLLVFVFNSVLLVSQSQSGESPPCREPYGDPLTEYGNSYPAR